MKDIQFYEVLSQKGEWRGNYSPLLDWKISVGTDAFTMAKINARHHGGKVFEVDSEGKRELAWPK